MAVSIDELVPTWHSRKGCGPEASSPRVEMPRYNGAGIVGGLDCRRQLGSRSANRNCKAPRTISMSIDKVSKSNLRVRST